MVIDLLQRKMILLHSLHRFTTAIGLDVEALSGRLGTEYSRGFDEFIRRPRHLCTVTHKAKVSQDYPGGHCMWVSVWFLDCTLTMLLLHNLVTALKSPRLCYTALNSVSRMLIWSWETTRKRQFVHALQIAFNIGRRVGSPLHFTLWWKQRVGNKVGGGAGNKALVGFNLRSAGGHTKLHGERIQPLSYL